MEKRNSAFVLVLVVILLSFSTIVFSEKLTEFSDMPEDWSRNALERAVENGLLRGKEGKIRGEENLTRAEMATIVNRAFNAEIEASLEEFTDIPIDEWYFREMQKAVHMRSFQGNKGKLNPKRDISREEAFVVLARCFKLSEDEKSSLNRFSDRGEISYWAEDSLAALVSQGYVSGMDGKIEPKKNITRAEFAKVMDNLISDYIVEKGEYSGDFNGNLMINRDGVILKNATVKGDLIIGDGVGSGDVILDHVRVTGRLLARGGGEDSIIIKGDSEIDNILAGKIQGRMRIKVESGNIRNMVLDCEDDIILEGNFQNLLLLGDYIQVDAVNSNIQKAKIEGKNSKLTLNKDSKINLLELDENAEGINLIIEDTGEIESVEINSEGTVIRGEGKINQIKDNSKSLKSYLASPKADRKDRDRSKKRDWSESEDTIEPEESEENEKPESDGDVTENDEDINGAEPKQKEFTYEGVLNLIDEIPGDVKIEDGTIVKYLVKYNNDLVVTDFNLETAREGKYFFIYSFQGYMDLVIEVTILEKSENPKINVEISATEIKIGDELLKSILSGSFENGNGEKVKGKLKWKDENQIVSQTGEYEWIFEPEDREKYNEVSGNIEVKANEVEVDPVLMVNNSTDFIKAIKDNVKHIRLTQSITLSQLSTTKPLIYNVQNGKIDLADNKLTVAKKYFAIRGEDTIIQNGKLETSGYSEIRFNGKNITMENITMDGSVYMLGVGSDEEISESNKYSLLIKDCRITTKDEGTENTYNIIEVSIYGNASVIVQGGSLTTNNKYAFRIAEYDGNSITIEEDVDLKLGKNTEEYDTSRSLAPDIKGKDIP